MADAGAGGWGGCLRRADTESTECLLLRLGEKAVKDDWLTCTPPLIPNARSEPRTSKEGTTGSKESVCFVLLFP